MAKQTNTKKKNTKVEEEPIIEEQIVETVEQTEEPIEIETEDEPIVEENTAEETAIETGEDAINPEPIHNENTKENVEHQGTYQAKPLTPAASTVGAYVAQPPRRH